MTASVLDTHRIVKRLRDAGATERLAETVTDVLREARELDLSQLATKADLALVRGEIAALATKAELADARGDLRREIAEAKTDTIRWVVGTGVVQVLALVGAVIAIVRFLPGGPP
jgi:hypothetical protein